jgi:nuclease S1
MTEELSGRRIVVPETRELGQLVRKNYVTRLETGWLTTPDAQVPGIDGGEPAQWAVETHKAAQEIWKLTPANRILDEDYYNRVLPVLDRQLGLAALRLTRFLTEVLGSEECAAL